ncbi:MFS transporter, partial [Escherichia coli]|uniref:MFS transporter n=1 Tax=Escherichia coli TaxID=562 RepID=UPI00192A6328
FMRPVGGIILGLYGDKKGRKAAMVLVTSLMAVSIALITVAPTYHAAGILAPIFILIARLLQGFSAGGEFGTSTALLIEMAPNGRRGFYGSWQMAGQMLALLLGGIGWGSLLLLRRITLKSLALRLAVNRLLHQPWVTISQLAAFSLSFMLLALLLVLRGDLLERWQQQLPPNSPNYFLLNM